MKPPPFDYRCPDTLDEALALLGEHGDDAKVLAGGQSLVPLLNFRLARPAVLVDLNRVPGLDTVTWDGDRLLLGAMVRERAAERSDAVLRAAPLLARALPLIGHPAIRTRGTIGGSLAHADPAAELPAVALASDAELVVRSASRGERVVPAADFFEGYFTTAVAADEILTELRLPAAAAGTGACFEEASRRHGDFAMVGAAATVRLDESGRIADARLALIGVADRPVRATSAEAPLVGAEPSPEAFAAAAAEAVRDLTPGSDLHASAAYRRTVAATLVARALTGATRAAGGTR